MISTSHSERLGWAGGVLDSEGCISLQVHRTKRWRSYVARVVVSNTDLRMLNRLQELFPLSKIVPKRQARLGRKLCYEWQVHATKAEAVLRDLLPHLVAKREQAETCLLARRFIGGKGGAQRRGKRTDRVQLEWLKRRLSELKRIPSRTDEGAPLDAQLTTPLYVDGDPEGAAREVPF